MKLLNVKTLKDGRKHLLIEIGKTEMYPVEQFKANSYYKLNYPMDDTIIEGHILVAPQPVMWDSYSQKWVDV
jgi:hypothetical protein